MRHWRGEYFQTLKDVAAEASETQAWAEYARFCAEYERGLRPQALSTLDCFICNLERKPFIERRNFVSWLLTKTHGMQGEHMAIPHPLRLRIIEPTLVEWTAEEPSCAEPHRWIGGYEHLKRALELDERDEIARRKLIVRLLRVGTHLLPQKYVGDPRRDLQALLEAETLLNGLPNVNERRNWSAEIKEERLLIQQHLDKAK